MWVLIENESETNADVGKDGNVLIVVPQNTYAIFALSERTFEVGGCPTRVKISVANEQSELLALIKRDDP